jgi:PAS domain S-box-containing protein
MSPHISRERTHPSRKRRTYKHVKAELPYRQVFESAVIGLAIVELDGKVRAVNQALCEMFGYSREELIGRSFPISTRPDDEAGRQIRQRLLAQEIDGFSAETQYLRKDGATIHAFTTASLVKNAAGEPSHFLSQIVNITSLRRAEQAGRESEEISARHAVELEQSNADLRQFAYLASHDLQQPLRGVASYARLLSDRYGQSLDARATRWITYITEGVDRMQRLIDDLFTLAGVGTDVTGFELVDTAVTARLAGDALLARNESVAATLLASDLPVIEGDPQQIELLFQNLLGNAFKYRQRDIPLEVSIVAERYASPLGAIWEFVVRDNGIGFDAAYSEQIFEIFRRLHSSAEYEGTGIGLALCRKIVERHGGRIWANSVVGNGSTFTFSLYEHHPN